jgi:peptidoglycan/LPS O-acetylase OafA/YrhL
MDPLAAVPYTCRRTVANARPLGTTMGRPVGQKHLVALDGLRGLAIISVILAHANLTFGGPFAVGRLAQPLAALMGCGWVGVDLFFVLSGFLITGILFDARDGSRFLWNFYGRRILRIMPLYFGYLVLLTVLFRLTPTVFDENPPSRGSLVSLWTYVYNFYVAFVTQSPVPLAHHFWSLSIEEHFYLVWPFVVLLFSRRALMQICVGGAVLAFVLRVAVVFSGAWLQIAYLITPCRLDGLLAGAFVALAVRDEADFARLVGWARTVALASGFLLLGLVLGQRGFVDFVDFRYIPGVPIDSSMTLTVGIAALALFFGSCLTLTLTAPSESVGRRFLESRWLTAIGFYSYGMYVFHELILAAILKGLRSSLPAAILNEGIVCKPLLALLVLGCSFLVAWFSYHVYEDRFLRLKRYFAYH